MDEAKVREAREDDVPAITAIYNHYVVHTPITFDVEPRSLDDRRAWLRSLDPAAGHRLLVVTAADAVLGYAATLPFRPKAAYRTSAEVTVYLRPDATGRGLGQRLYAGLFAAVAGSGLHRAYAGITLPNPASQALHRRFGFRPLGVYHEVGHKFERFWDVQWLEKRLD